MGRIVLGACLLCACAHVSPAARSPLKEKLERPDTSELVEKAGVCFERIGWKVDQFPQPFGDTTRVRATKSGVDAAIYIYPKGAIPRITGDMAEGEEPFWACLQGSL